MSCDKERCLIIIVLAVVFMGMIMPAIAGAAWYSGSLNLPWLFEYKSYGSWHDLKTAKHWIDTKITDTEGTAAFTAYCLEHEKDMALGEKMTEFAAKNAFAKTRTLTGLKAIVQNGYPSTKAGLTSAEARYATANAIRTWLWEQEKSGYSFMADGNVRAKSGNKEVFTFYKKLLADADTGNYKKPSVSIAIASNWKLNGSGKYVATAKVSYQHANRYKIVSSSGITVSNVSAKGANGDTITLTVDKSMAGKPVTLILAIESTSYESSLKFLNPASSKIQREVAVGFMESFTTPFTWTMPVGTLRMVKVDKISGEKLKGATFALYNGANTMGTPVTTGTDGIAQFNNLPFGDYKISEITSPSGYKLEGPWHATISDSFSPVVVIAANTPVPPETGDAAIYKVDQDDPDLFLPGAVFTFSTYLSGAFNVSVPTTNMFVGQKIKATSTSSGIKTIERPVISSDNPDIAEVHGMEIVAKEVGEAVLTIKTSNDSLLSLDSTTVAIKVSAKPIGMHELLVDKVEGEDEAVDAVTLIGNPAHLVSPYSLYIPSTDDVGEVTLQMRPGWSFLGWDDATNSLARSFAKNDDTHFRVLSSTNETSTLSFTIDSNISWSMKPVSMSIDATSYEIKETLTTGQSGLAFTADYRDTSSAYCFREIEAPEGYQLVNEPILVRLRKGQQVACTMGDPRKPRIDILKKDAVSGAFINDTIFTLEHKTGSTWSSEATATTNDDGECFFMLGTLGQYRVTESVANPLYATSSESGYESTRYFEYKSGDTSLTPLEFLNMPIEIATEISKKTISLTSAGFKNEEYDNTVTGRKELYGYQIDYRNTSNTGVDELTVDDPLECVSADQVRVDEIFTPVVVGDLDGKLNIWCKTNKTDDGITYSNFSAMASNPYNPLNPDNTPRLLNTGYRLIAQDVDATVQQRLLVADFAMEEGEFITSLRYEHGAVAKGFTTKNTDGWSLHPEDSWYSDEASAAVGLWPASYFVYCPNPLTTSVETSGSVDWGEDSALSFDSTESPSVDTTQTVINNSTKVEVTRNIELTAKDTDAAKTRVVSTFALGQNEESPNPWEDSSSSPLASSETTTSRKPLILNLPETGDRAAGILLWLVLLVLASVIAIGANSRRQKVRRKRR